MFCNESHVFVNNWKECFFMNCSLVFIFIHILPPLSIGGSVNIWLANIPAFAILYSLGSIVSIASSMFLRGPIAQIKSMADPTRALTTFCMIFFLVLTLMAGLWWNNMGLCLLFFVLQYLSWIWYLCKVEKLKKNSK